MIIYTLYLIACCFIMNCNIDMQIIATIALSFWESPVLLLRECEVLLPSVRTTSLSLSLLSLSSLSLSSSLFSLSSHLSLISLLSPLSPPLSLSRLLSFCSSFISSSYKSLRKCKNGWSSLSINCQAYFLHVSIVWLFINLTLIVQVNLDFH